MSKVNWIKVKAYYLSHEDSSYADLSRIFDVSTASVKKRQISTKENWPNLRKEISQKVAQKLPEKLSETLAEVKARHIYQVRILQELSFKALNENGPKKFSEAKEALLAGMKVEEELLFLDLDKDKRPEDRVRQIMKTKLEFYTRTI